MTLSDGSARLVGRLLASTAIVFGVVTVVAGARVLAGSDPGYVVFRPLVLYNTAMGIAYVAAGVAMARGSRWALRAAGAIFVLNLMALGVIGYLYGTGSAIAPDSLRAMAFRAFVWLVLFLGTAWTSRGVAAHGPEVDRV